jgi:hypothetical protein
MILNSSKRNVQILQISNEQKNAIQKSINQLIKKIHAKRSLYIL